MSRAGLILLVLIAALLAGLWLFGPFAVEEEVALPRELDYPAYYRAEASGEIGWRDDSGESVRVPGRMRVAYVVYPDARAAVTHLSAWIDDLVIEDPYPWWPGGAREFRCTTFSNADAIRGTLDGDRITIPAGVVLTGRTYEERGPGGECRGPAMSFEFATEAEAVVLHDPESDRFALSTGLTSGVDGGEIELGIDVEGRFLNRPPVAILSTAAAGDGEEGFDEGCPGSGKGDPPVAPANSADGLRLLLRSSSYDPDGPDVTRVGMKNPRFDLRLERWLHSDGGRFRLLGDGPSPGEVLFATGREHRLLLVAVDRAGSQDRAYCRFRVEPAEERR